MSQLFESFGRPSVSPVTTGNSPIPTRRVRLPGGRTVAVTPVFDTYWRFAFLRQQAFMRRVHGEMPPWTEDPIISAHRFTNAYRASDRVSQYLIRNVIYDGSAAQEEVFFRTILFKLFNRIETWEHLQAETGSLTWRGFNLAHAEKALDRLLTAGTTVYSAAYIMPSPAFGEARKHANHLRLLAHMMKDGAPRKVARAKSLEQVFEILLQYPSLGRFLAFQLAIDLNYGPGLEFSEMDFVVAGPGARDGMKKCFADAGGLSDADLIRATSDLSGSEFERQGFDFQNLWGRELQLIDCQNLFCEVDKYARVAHPEIAGASGRTRIKQRFSAALRPLPQWYPPKWGLAPPKVKAAPARVVQSKVSRQRSLFAEHP